MNISQVLVGDYEAEKTEIREKRVKEALTRYSQRTAIV